MNRPLFRTTSAGGGVNRLGVAGGGRSRPSSGRRGAVDATTENRALREQVSSLQHELLLTKAESKKVSDQLNCLVDLIKRAWTGDKSANVHVANIVGLAPPDFIETNNGVNSVTLVTKPKSRAVNHWAVLTIGLLNREYRRMEKELEVKQLCYFQRRQAYLEEQLSINRDQMSRLTQSPHPQNGQQSQNGHQSAFEAYRQVKSAPTERHCTSPIEGMSGQIDPFQTHHYGWQEVSMPNRININKPPSAGLQRKASAKYRKPKEAEPEVDLTWADLVIEPLQGQKINKTTNMAMDGMYRLPKQQSEKEQTVGAHGEEFDEDRIHLTYDDPHRYTQNGLFNVAEALGNEAVTRGKRPLSGQMKHADSIRSRPRSAVVKQERPLKYETTRPVSASKASHLGNNKTQIQTKNTKHQQDNLAFNALRPESAKSTARSVTSRRDQNQMPKPDPNAVAEELRMRKAKLLKDDPELAELINVDITQPECIKEFDDEILEMQNKEIDFKKRAVDLQKKLGITSGGMLYPDH